MRRGLDTGPCPRIHSRGAFTLIEVMVTTAVLSLGIVLIYQSYFTVLRASDYCSTYFSSVGFVDEKLWAACDSVRRQGTISDTELSGELQSGGKKFTWAMWMESGQAPDLYAINVQLSWKDGARNQEIRRTAYALYEKILK